MIDDSYFRDIVSSLEKVLYYERGRGAYFRSTLVGKEFVDRMPIGGNTPEEVIENCLNMIHQHDLVKHADYKRDKNGTLFIFELKGCVHLPIEAKLDQEGVPAYICSPVNMVLYKIRELTGLAVEIADITVNQDDQKCIIRVVVFKQD